MDTAERFQLVAELFETARSMRSDERASYLEDKCNGDAELINEVRRLLGHHETRHGPLEEPITPAMVKLASPRQHGVELPEAIGEYRVARLIGAGGMGAVYLAEQRNPKRKVALKVIRPGVVSRDALRRFELEASMLGRLQHVGIAQIYEAGTYNDGVGARPYFAMEYVEGAPVLENAESHDLGTNARLKLIAQICDAVQHAHQQGVIHRDLKPGNILVDETGQPKILDFGVARSTDEGAHSLATQAGALLGTIGYMSPEQIDGNANDVDTRTDVHALGVTMYELLAGRMPYDLSDTSMTGALHRVREDVPALLGSIQPGLRGDIETICAKALEKDKSRRYQSASDLRDDIHRFLRNEPITARPASTMYQMQRLAQRNKPLVVAAGVVLLALVGTLVVLSIAAYEISRQRDEAIAAMSDATGATQFLSDMLTSLDPRERGTPDVSLTNFLDDVTERLDSGQLDEQPKVEAAVRHTIGVAYRELGRYDQARSNIERSLELYRADAHASTTNIADAMSSLGATWSKAGEIEKAERYLAESIQILETVKPDERYGVAGAYQSLADIRMEQRRLDEAEQLLLSALELRRTDPTQRPHFIARNLNSLAVVYRLSGKVDSARSAYEEAIAIQRTLHREPRLDLAHTMSNLAVLHMYEEDLDTAQPLLEEVLRIRKALLPEIHPDIAQTYNSLGGLHTIREQWSQAETVFRESIRIRAALFGDDHYSLGTPYANLGVVQGEQGQYADAIVSLNRAIAIRCERFGQDHVQTASPLLHLANVYIEMNDAEHAIECAEKVRSIYVSVYGDVSPNTLVASSVLGYSLSLAGRFSEAEPLVLRADKELNALADPSPAAARSIVRNRAWIVAMYHAWHEAEPDKGYNQSALAWEPAHPIVVP